MFQLDVSASQLLQLTEWRPHVVFPAFLVLRDSFAGSLCSLATSLATTDGVRERARDVARLEDSVTGVSTPMSRWTDLDRVTAIFFSIFP